MKKSKVEVMKKQTVKKGAQAKKKRMSVCHPPWSWPTDEELDDYFDQLDQKEYEEEQKTKRRKVNRETDTLAQHKQNTSFLSLAPKI